ncbi:response regulator [Flavobacterium hungaricum]|uniref:Response regulator n=1 Tax=Flavobacterium hungaricum TaxID=2082725 RepID=A0ABR9TPF9_9FLAO|nr:response regulator [Flavobacterium hungaricum]MBE8726882.1 response regulator [Flavobacterium hungaricum]
MFKKVILAEDFEEFNLAVKQTLNDLNIVDFQHAKYCDDALTKIKRALQDNQPYDLLISDLSFKKDHREVKIGSGDELIQKVREIQPNLKIIAYSIEDKNPRIKSLFENSEIDAFVLKGRNSIVDLKKAIQVLSTSNEKFISPEIASALHEKNNYEIDDVDIKILKYLSDGTSQDEIIEIFKSSDVKPNSKSAVEKRLSKLKDFFKANNTVHLVSITKDMGII